MKARSVSKVRSKICILNMGAIHQDNGIAILHHLFTE